MSASYPLLYKLFPDRDLYHTLRHLGAWTGAHRVAFVVLRV